ncbi:hypothetical protein JQ604_00425 [Bradyrhizobium jicamae]|uniref:hypothetical protein n=1 Tax=Bradyrhizobium jicamae TaxID=280332 RepID=UPI001BA83949|nr:hypothetical protein [Bradyrhizobium jicamae]MBR0750642.1 hypothetical protein [Bradyrhizobium jicamae]
MFRTSSLLAVAFTVAALGSATVPASAMPNGFHPSPVSGGVKPIQPVKPPQGLPSGGKGPVVGVVGLGPKKPPVVNPPKLPPPPPPKTPKPIIGMPIDNVCPLNKWKCPPKPWPFPPKPGKPPIVVVLPPVQVGVPVPVGVPVTVPVRQPSGGGYIPAQPRPVMQQAVQSCQGMTVPQLASGIDQLLPTAQLSDEDKARVTSLRQSIQELATDGKESAARDTEEIAMNILGYKKVSLTCGAFDWEKLQPDARADAGPATK